MAPSTDRVDPKPVMPALNVEVDGEAVGSQVAPVA
jgi:hypothetical protein